MTSALVKKILLGGVPPLAVGGTGIGIWMSKPRSEEVPEAKENAWRWRGVKEGEDAEVTEEPADLIRQAGLNCGDATEEKDCNIGSTGLNVDIDGVKKENLFPSKTDNGNIRFRLTKDSTYNNNFRFTVTEAPIKLESKTNPSETIILEKYDTYEVVKDNDTNKVYLTKKFTAGEWIKKALGLPTSCNLPTTVSTNSFNYKNPTCEITIKEIKSVNFEGKKNGGATTTDKVKLYIKRVNDTKTFKGGYKFTFHPHQDVEIKTGDKIKANIWKDFRIKDPDAEELVLERIWKGEEELLKAVGLSCTKDDTCTIEDGSLKIKAGTSSMEMGKRKSGSIGTLKIKRELSGYYEGLKFLVQGGEIEIDNDSNSTTVKMKELEIFHIRKEDSNESTYFLSRKHDLEEMILFNLGLGSCNLTKSEDSKKCIVKGSTDKNPLEKIKFHDGTGEKKITGNANNSLEITVSKGEEKTTYPFGYKFSIATDSENITMGNITLTNNFTDFKIKKENEADGPKLYLEKVNQ